MNPFRYGCVVEGDFFCPRPALEKELRRFVDSGQNVVMQGERRMGKTSLICETVRRMRGVKLLYADLFGVRTTTDFCRKVAAAAARLGTSRRFLDRLVSLVPRLRPVISFDPETGAPSFSIDARAASEPDSADSIFEMIGALSREMRLCVVFDEFQDLLNVENAHGLLAGMRGKIQFQAETPYVFLGSVRNKMSEIFTGLRSPFCKSAILFDVGRIDDEDFASFIEKRFGSAGRKVTRGTVTKILDAADRISGDVQELCDALWACSSRGEELGDGHLTEALRLVWARESKGYVPVVSRLTALQLRVLRGIAEFGGRGITGKEFLAAMGTANAASVRKSALRMAELDILMETGDGFRFSNPFFALWLKGGGGATSSR